MGSMRVLRFRHKGCSAVPAFLQKVRLVVKLLHPSSCGPACRRVERFFWHAGRVGILNALGPIIKNKHGRQHSTEWKRPRKKTLSQTACSLSLAALAEKPDRRGLSPHRRQKPTHRILAARDGIALSTDDCRSLSKQHRTRTPHSMQIKNPRICSGSRGFFSSRECAIVTRSVSEDFSQAAFEFLANASGSYKFTGSPRKATLVIPRSIAVSRRRSCRSGR